MGRKVYEFERELCQEYGMRLQVSVKLVAENRRMDEHHMEWIAAVVACVGETMGVTPTRIVSRDRKADAALARQIAVYLVKKYRYEIPNVTIARYVMRDHTSVGHFIQLVYDYLKIGDARMTHGIAICEPEVAKLFQQTTGHATPLHEAE